MDRLEQIRGYLAASVDSEGKPLKGFKNRVIAIRAEIARLENLVTATAANSMDSVEVDMPQEHA